MITANVEYDKKALIGLMRFSVVDKPWKWAIYGAFFLFALIFMLCSIGNNILPFSIIIFVFVCITISFTLFGYFINPIIKMKKFSEENIVLNHFSFEDSAIKIESKSKKRNGSSEIPYSAFTRIDESGTTFYLFVNKTSALIITKASITDGTTDELKSFLLSKIPNKKINKLSAK